jgi:Fe-S-cluster-containing dehydrogenase component
MGPFVRFSCWHCPDAPCIKECPRSAIKQEATGAVSVNNALCEPTLCKAGSGPRPCEIGCQQGGYPKVGEAYETGTYAGAVKMNKCTLCTGRAGADGVVDAATALPTRARATSGTYPNQVFASDLPLPSGGTLPNPTVPELAHEPACVSSCPAKAMRWDSKANILAYLNDSANGFTLANGTQNWIGAGAVYWASRKTPLVPPKADPFIEDHLTPMVSSMMSGGGKLMIPTLLLGGFAVVSMRRAKIQAEASELSVREV